ncbi:MAG: PEGA domain-containing protein [Endomicrobium sp.]|jgi:hypothetical protein|nr:PEGA domain-containing protein [Endomicrobium sp.]
MPLFKIIVQMPISLRKVKPQTYIVTATKDGFKPVQRIVRINERTKLDKAKQTKIEIMFDLLLDVNPEPQAVEVYVDDNKFEVTPCRIELTAGKHTVKLNLSGYEMLVPVQKR